MNSSLAKKRRPSLIAFSGLDGAGKSTQIDLLIRQYQANGASIRRFWLRGGYTPGFEMLKRILRRLRPGALPKPGRNEQRRELFRSPRVRRLWLAIAIIDLILLVCWFRMQLFLGSTVVLDRYLDDTLLDFRLNFPNENVEKWRLWRFLRRVAPIPDQVFVFVIPVAESLRRAQLKHEPFPDSQEVLTARLQEYEQLLSRNGYTRMDGLRTREDLHADICTACGLNA